MAHECLSRKSTSRIYIIVQKFKNINDVKWSELSYFISEASLGDLEGVPGPEGPAGPAGTKIRAVANFTTAVLDDDAQETGTVDLARTYMVLKVTTDVPARVRLYRDTASRTADAARLTSVAPTGNHGVVLDVVTTLEDLEWLIDVPGSSELVACPYLVDNLSGSSSAVDVNITYVELEDEPAS